MARTLTAPPFPHVVINRAPVLSLWGAVVAERLGHASDAAATLGEAVSILNAQSKGRRLGIFEPAPTTGRPPQPRQDERVELLGRAVPVVRKPAGPRAVVGGDVLDPRRIAKKLEQRFGENYAAVRDVMTRVAASYPPAELAGAAYGLYERFRPSVPAGTRGWGARGELDLALLDSLKKRRGRTPARTTGTSRHRGTRQPRPDRTPTPTVAPRPPNVAGPAPDGRAPPLAGSYPGRAAAGPPPATDGASDVPRRTPRAAAALLY